MSSPKKTKRSSILKKRASNFESPEPTQTTTKLPRRGILFSQKNTVKEFTQCDEKTTIWGNSYETSIAKSEGSSDGSVTAKKLSFDFSSSNIHVSSTTPYNFEAEKENFVVDPAVVHLDTARESVLAPPTPERYEEIRQTLSPVSTSCSTSGSTLENMTVEMKAEEKKRIKKYGVDNLNITNMQLDSTLSKKNEEELVRSPRKTIYFHDEANMSISLHEKVLVKKEEAAGNSVILNCTNNLSIKLESDEASFIKPARKTICKPRDMDLSLDSKPYPLRPDEKTNHQQVFKQPGLPKAFMLNSHVVESTTANIDSPPIKQPNLNNQKQVVDEFFELLVTETPTKDLCAYMCASRKRSITPSNKPPAKILFSSTKTGWKKRTNSTDLLRAMGLNLDHSCASSMHTSQVVEEVTQNFEGRKTNFNPEISLDVPSTSTLGARKNLFESDSLSVSEMQQATKENSFFELEMETVAGTENMNLVKLKDIAVPIEEEEQETAFNEDISFTCNFNGQNSSCDRSGISETTIELAEKAARLLKDPMATTASTSNLFSRTFQQEVDIDLSDSPLAKEIRNDSINKSADYLRQILSHRASKAARGTVYDQNISLQLSVEEQIPEEAMMELTSRFNIDISGIEPTVEIPQNNCFTIFEDSVDKEKYNLPSFKMPMQSKITSSRKTIHDTSTAMVTSPIIFTSQKSEENRKLVIQNDSTTEGNKNYEESESIPLKIPQAQPSKSRLTLFNNESIIETVNIVPSLLVREPVGSFGLSDSKRDLLVESENRRYEEKRLTIYEADISVQATYAQLESKPRQTSYEDQMDETCNDLYVDEGRHNFNYSEQQMDESQLFVPGNPQFSISDETFKIPQPIPSELKNPQGSIRMSIDEPLEVPEPNVEVTDNIQEMLRKSVIMRAPASTSSANRSLQMDMDESVNSSDSNNTESAIKVRRDENKKLLDITSAEIVSLIDDESSPNLEGSSRTEVQPTNVNLSNVSFGSNLSNYQRALQDFVNVTINTSALNMSRIVNEPEPSIKGQFHIHKVPEIIDYSAKLNDLMASLEAKNDDEKPKLEIDEFLGKLNIKHVKIRRAPELEPGYLMKQLEETKEKLKREENERKASLVPQFPTTPDYGFLIDNKLQWMHEEVQVELERKRRESLIALTPIFPESRDFDFLLKNKFLTDKQLSDIWKLDLTFAWMKQYKLVNKRLPGFKINLTVQKTESINDSTIPIYFEKVLMYTDPNYRKVKSTRTTLIMREFHRSIGTDVFTSMCRSDKELLTFLQYFHEQAKKTVSLVDNFLAIINNHFTVLEQQREGEQLIISHISKRIFLADGDIVDIMINLHGYIEDISAKDVVVEGLSQYAYEVQPRPNISDMKGLFIIEFILFESEKFLRENTRRSQKE